MNAECRVVDNRVFLLGLDELYREAMKIHERAELLMCAQRVATTLRLEPAKVQVEGYYAEDPQLREYFWLVRALQECDEDRKPKVAALPEYQRLLEVTSAPLFGRPQQKGKLLPVGRDALTQAMMNYPPSEWTVERLTNAADVNAREIDEFSLVGLAARARDSTVLAALRESVVLYAEMATGCALKRKPPKYVWEVDQDLADHARRFIDTFNNLFDEKLPPPEPDQAERFWTAYKETNILGRCVRLGKDRSLPPVKYYHWAICRDTDGDFKVQAFWHSDLWTTQRYRSMLRGRGQCLEL